MNIRTKDLNDYHYRLDNILKIVEEDRGIKRGSDGWAAEMKTLFDSTMKGNAIYESAKSTPSELLHEEAMQATNTAIKEHNENKRD
jgi:hypothetical protein